MKLAAADPPLRFVVVGIGTPEVLANLPVLAGRLAAAAGLPLRSIRSPEDPQESLADLAGSGAGWLAALPIDPGLPLPAGGSWAEALGAWRQPTLLVLMGDQLATGLPAAATALLRQCGVPLLGLVQAGGRWQAGERRRDGLPWLGAVGVAESGGPEEVLTVVLLRWRQLLELPPTG